ncbi:glycosylase [Stratiformator vulcanicus]|uniref:Glycosyl hydrolases family 43 n=1 Tax=Stratiformator vulcanicus TaxID=2527980 RepID=A0A517R216_9PLAN|nr:glycosylase [Stratiformator vulcanicus]QDT37912.1 hypothetical protein Pan189_22950 [Stratiformator vulcanicus]
MRLTLPSLKFFIAVGILISGSLAGAEQPPFPPELTKFVPYSDNPVFEAAGEGNWDVKIRERGWILKRDGQWHMWFTGYDGERSGMKKLGYATSTDGIEWKRHPSNPIYQEHWVEDMMVVDQGGRLWMFAEGLHDQSQLLVSDNGIDWKRVGTLDVRLTDGTPIPAGPYGTPTAWYEDGIWYLFYERRDAGVWLATSEDMRVWTNVSDDPVLSPGPGEYDRKMIAMNQIVKFEDRYYALFHGTAANSSPSLWSSGIAVSDDLKNWTKYKHNPLRPTKENRSSNILVRDGSQFRLYTMHDRVDLYVRPHDPKLRPKRGKDGH